ncbi:F-box protein CPR1-like [Papaver somniferum]|uniref:F-box protein CPR1-like n=1 Tax=Papaver somniferum TaxID=3469 RepID=UPI000E6F63F1|nr:F-box protein CPR1-like [Papaver somniferum]
MSISSRTRSKLKQIESTTSLLLNLPEEVQDEIFLKLPAKSILVSRCVCKVFYNLLSKPRFIKNHVNRTNQFKINPKILFNHPSPDDKTPMIYSVGIDYASFSSPSIECGGAVLLNYPFESENLYFIDFLGSCNGVICLRICSPAVRDAHERGYPTEATDFFVVFNPLTREYKEFRKPGHGYDSTYGFGYDSEIDDYKLVTISDYVRTGSFEIDVCKVRTDSWSSIQSTANYIFCDGGKGHGVFFSGALHWLGRITAQETSSEVCLVCIDISNEIIVNMPLADNMDHQRIIYANVGVLGDCICIAFIWDSVRIDVWVMHDYGVKESWIKKFTAIPTSWPSSVLPFWKPLWCYDSGEILVDSNRKMLVLYDPTNKKARSAVVHDIKIIACDNVRSVLVLDIGMDYNREIYVESIASLNSGTYLEKRIADVIVKIPSDNSQMVRYSQRGF